MDRVIVVDEQDFEGQPMVNGGFRWVSTELFEKHGAQVTRVTHPPGAVVAPHVHTVDEVFYLLEGDLRLGDRSMPTGSVLFIGAHTPYGFTVGEHGVTWVMVRPNRAALDRADGTDYREVGPGEAKGDRGVLLTPAEIAAAPVEDLDGADGLRWRPLIDRPGYPRVALVEVGSEHRRPQSASERHQFLCVVSGRLRVADRTCGPGSVISVPVGQTCTPVADEGTAAYLLVESATG